MAKKDFEKLLLESVDEALASLGGSARQAVYFHLKSEFKIERKEIPQRFEEFAEGIEQLFGVGAQFLEILMMKKLYERIGQSLEWDKDKELMFVEYVAAAKRSFLKERERSKTLLQK